MTYLDLDLIPDGISDGELLHLTSELIRLLVFFQRILICLGIAFQKCIHRLLATPFEFKDLCACHLCCGRYDILLCIWADALETP